MFRDIKKKRVPLLIVLGLAVFFGAAIFGYSKVRNLNSAVEKRDIPVAFSSDNNYVYPTIVAITSMMETSSKMTNYKVYILVSGDMTQDNKQKLLSLGKYYKNCDINLIDMEDSFSENEKSSWGTAMYYRLKLSSLLPDKDKCIYLDGDTIIDKDLYELYSINMDDYYVAGVADDRRLYTDYASVIGIPDMEKYVCSGVLLWNSKNIRRDGLEIKFKDFIDIKVNKEKVSACPDQDAINVVCYDAMKDLPFKYGVMMHMGIDIPYEENKAAQKCYSKEDWEEGIKEPVIIHYSGTKPWKGNSGKFQDKWISYAKKTPYYNEISAKYFNS